ncbi:tRNA lysidine(34) synthetase TilS [Candidatus Saccharibacteria bacterium]|nr:tRNA lysidine(34) synthetase TilS [Candidatus Saccharibacteria bacterium]
MKYVLAISGGVDSCVLLNMIATSFQEFCDNNFPDAIWPDDFIVAHFEHGVRGLESKKDVEFVRNLAEKYNVKFALGEGNLSPNCSEELAREKRYEFLRKVANCHSEIVEGSIQNLRRSFDYAQDDTLIVTAHHQDDLLETIVINLIRGTGWRGLAPMSDPQILRPLLKLTKFEIINYALENNLNWVEDATNFSPNYLRNRVRDFLANWPKAERQKLLDLYEKQRTLRTEIEKEIAEYDKKKLSRYFLTMIDESSALEILREATKGKLTYPQLRQTLIFAKTALPHKKNNFKDVKIHAELREIIIETK